MFFFRMQVGLCHMSVVKKNPFGLLEIPQGPLVTSKVMIQFLVVIKGLCLIFKKSFGISCYAGVFEFLYVHFGNMCAFWR